jgi:hypothetical protein
MAQSVGFTQVENSFLDDETLSPEARWIGVYYARYCNSVRRAYPGLKNLMKSTGFGRDRVKRSRKELLDRGFLQVHRNRRGAGRL